MDQHAVSDMTYSVFGGTLNPTLLLLHRKNNVAYVKNSVIPLLISAVAAVLLQQDRLLFLRQRYERNGTTATVMARTLTYVRYVTVETRHESTSKIKARVIAQSYTSRITYACRYFTNNYVIGHEAIVGKAVSMTVVRSDVREVTIYKSTTRRRR